MENIFFKCELILWPYSFPICALWYQVLCIWAHCDMRELLKENFLLVWVHLVVFLISNMYTLISGSMHLSSLRYERIVKRKLSSSVSSSCGLTHFQYVHYDIRFYASELIVIWGKTFCKALIISTDRVRNQNDDRHRKVRMKLLCCLHSYIKFTYKQNYVRKDRKTFKLT